MPKQNKIQNNYAFIDSQNLNLAINSQGWRLDFARFRVYLKDKYKVEKAFLFIGYIPTKQTLYTSLKDSGYQLIYKPTIKDSEGKAKGNVDAELVLHTMIQLNNFDKAVIVSGDGDFFCLIEYLLTNDKLARLLIPNRKKYSRLLWRFNDNTDYVTNLKDKLRTR